MTGYLQCFLANFSAGTVQITPVGCYTNATRATIFRTLTIYKEPELKLPICILSCIQQGMKFASVEVSLVLIVHVHVYVCVCVLYILLSVVPASVVSFCFTCLCTVSHIPCLCFYFLSLFV